MIVLKRIISAPSNANRTPEGTLVVPNYPDVTGYEGLVVGNKDVFEKVKECVANNIGLPAVRTNIAPQEIGYLIEHNKRVYAVPTHLLKSFMSAYGVKSTDPAGHIVAIQCGKGIALTGTEPVTLDNPSVLSLYGVDNNMMVEARLQIEESFQVKEEVGSRRITPKGIGSIPALKLVHKEIVGVMRGEVIDASWNDELLNG